MIPSEILNVLAAGMVGEGSDCFGFDDEISKTKDFIIKEIDENFFKPVSVWDAISNLPAMSGAFRKEPRFSRENPLW